MSGVIDPTKAAKYPVVLSDALLGGPAKNVFTNIRYNHKPELSSETAPEQARLKPATADSTDSYELSFQDGDSKYAYAGTRTIGDNQYILYFDPSRKVFVLDKVDSAFDMNITRTPETTDPEALRRQFEHLGASGESTSIVARGGRPAATTASTAAAAAAAAKAGFRPPPKRKVAPKKKKEESGGGNANSSANKQQPSEQLRREEGKKAMMAKNKNKRRDAESEEDDDDDDDPLLVEYPGAAPTRHDDFSPAFPDNAFPLRRFSEFAEKLRESGNEFDDEKDTSSEGGLNGFKLPSPVGRAGGNQQHEEESDEDDEIEMEDVRVGGGAGDAGAERDLAAELEAGLESGLKAHLSAELDEMDGEGDLERDLAAELENELMMGNSGQDADSESEVSEED